MMVMIMVVNVFTSVMSAVQPLKNYNCKYDDKYNCNCPYHLTFLFMRILVAVLEALLLEELERHCQRQGTGTGKHGAKPSGQVNSQKIQGESWNCGNTGHQSKDW